MALTSGRAWLPARLAQGAMGELIPWVKPFPMALGILSAKGGALGLVNAVERGCCASGRALLHGTWTEVVEPSLGSTAPMPADRYRQQSPS